MKDFLKTILGAIIAVPVIVYGGLLLLGFLMNVLNFSFGKAVLTIFLSPFALAILYFVLKFLWELISEEISSSTNLKSFLMNSSLNVIGIASIIVWFCFVFAISSWMNIVFLDTILVVIVSIFIIGLKNIDSIIKVFALPVVLFILVKIFVSLPINIIALMLLAVFVILGICRAITGSSPPPPPPPKGTRSQQIWADIHQNQLEELERERDNLRNEIHSLKLENYNGELDREISDKEWKLSNLDDKIRDKRRQLLDELH